MQSNRDIKRTYIHPPIAEAVIEVRIERELSLKDLEKIAKKLKKSYPNSQPVNNFHIDISQNLSVNNPKVHHSIIGLILSSEDQANIVNLNPKSLSIVRRAPYPGWDDFFSNFIAVWKAWKSVSKTCPMSRVGIRYINRIDIPANEHHKIEIKDYLTIYPEGPGQDNEPMDNYLIQVVKPTSNRLWSTSITSTNQPSPLVNTVSLLLDIDLFRTQDIPLNDDELFNMVTEGRRLKNDIFNQCITPKTMEILNQ